MSPISRRLPVVVLEQPAQSFPGLNIPLALRRRPTDQHVADALMAALLLVVSRVLGDRMDERFAPQEDHLIKTLGFD